MEAGPSVHQEKAEVTLEKGGKMSLAYGVSSSLPDDPTCIVIAHGAGGPMYSPFISHFHTELAKKGFLTVKFNFPYMEGGKKTLTNRVILKQGIAGSLEELSPANTNPRGWS